MQMQKMGLHWLQNVIKMRSLFECGFFVLFPTCWLFWCIGSTWEGPHEHSSNKCGLLRMNYVKDSMMLVWRGPLFVTHRTKKEEKIACPSGLSCQTYARLFFSPVDLPRATLDVCSILYERQGLSHPGDMALQAPLLQGHRDAKADSACLTRKQKHSTYQSAKILWL